MLREELRTPDLLHSPKMARPGISTKTTQKIPPPPRPEILDSQNFAPSKYPENTDIIPPKYRKNARFGIFFSAFWGYFFRGVPDSDGPGGGEYFLAFFVKKKFRVGPFRGSVAGRGFLNFREGPERHLDAARQKLPRDNFCRSVAAQLPSPRGQF